MANSKLKLCCFISVGLYRVLPVIPNEIYPLPQQAHYNTIDSMLLSEEFYLFGFSRGEKAEEDKKGQASQTDEVLGSLHCHFQYHNDHRSTQRQNIKRP